VKLTNNECYDIIVGLEHAIMYEKDFIKVYDGCDDSTSAEIKSECIKRIEIYRSIIRKLKRDQAPNSASS
jgi:hypothetical protein